MHSLFRRILYILIFFLLLSISRVFALDVPVLRSYVNDFAGALSAADRDVLERALRTYDEATSTQFVVLIISSLEGESLEDYAIAVAEKNQIGRKGKDNGLLFLVAINDRKMRFEVGYGLEPVLTDALTSVIISDIIAPEFRQGNYAKGISDGMTAAMKAARGEFMAPPARERKDEEGGSIIGFIIFLLILFFFFRGGRGRRGWGGMWFIGPWFGGGGFGGGSFGGGGFGGFSGGGGSFGGGGSSGSW